jgi:murein DD-endopeptidase MepM/ murein hydrolase activator NlpD
MMNMKQILFNLIFAGICITFLNLPLVVKAQVSTEKNINTEIRRIHKDEPKLVADKATVRNELLAIDSVLTILELGGDADVSLAEDLYDGEWNNEYVKAYANIAIPDTFRIDVTGFIMPVLGRVTSPFGPRRRRFHYGTDVKLQVGDTVVAAFDGKVRIKKYERSGYGYYLVLRHPNGLETVYGHLSEFLVNEDETVKAGQPIALGGNTGRSTGSHLHFECRFLGQAIDPSVIVDFENSCTFDDSYVFKKSLIEEKYYKSKYTANAKKNVKYHRVRAGDTLATISRRYGVAIDKLCRLNGLKRTSTLKIGKSIRYS